MSEKKPSPSINIVIIPDSENNRSIDINIIDRPLIESIIPSMQAPEEWPLPPDVDIDNINNG